MRITQAIVYHSKTFDFMGASNFSSKSLFPIVTEEGFQEYTLSADEYSLALEDCRNFIQLHQLLPQGKDLNVFRY
jgi:hypothetical protein